MHSYIARCLICIYLLLLLTTTLIAQETSDPFAGGFTLDEEEQESSDEFGGGFGTDGGFSIDEPAGGDGSSDTGGFGDFSGSFSTGAGASPLSLGGRLEFTGRGTADHDNPEETPIDLGVGARLDLSYTADRSEFFTRLDFAQEIDTTLDLSEFAENSIDESYASFFYDRFTFHAGYMKTVWGTGDEIHVVDLLNSDDYTDFINPDYLDRRSATGMFKLDVPVGAIQIELAYLPILNPDTVPESGLWAPVEIAALENLYAGYVTGLVSLAYEDDELATASDRDRVMQYEDVEQLEDAQVGVRLTTTAGRFDLGIIYYWGFVKTPVPRIRLADETLAAAFVANPAGSVYPGPSADGEIELDYPRLHAFGLESAAVFGPFNTRAELAYYLTEDIEGDDPEVPNNSINYLAGFDVDLPLSSLNLNVQAIGAVILSSDKIDDAGQVANATPEIAELLTLLGYDELDLLIVDPGARYNYEYNEDGIYTDHIVSVSLSDSYRNERIRPEVAVGFGVEYQDWRIRPAIEWDLLDDATAEVGYTIYAGDEKGRFGYFDENDFIEARFRYSF